MNANALRQNLFIGITHASRSADVGLLGQDSLVLSQQSQLGLSGAKTCFQSKQNQPVVSKYPIGGLCYGSQSSRSSRMGRRRASQMVGCGKLFPLRGAL